eukprot:5401322-Ditylum_brightwellii.AAC.1
MAYQHYTNLHEKFRGDLISKVNKDVESLNFMNSPCNCSRSSKDNSACELKGSAIVLDALGILLKPA